MLINFEVLFGIIIKNKNKHDLLLDSNSIFDSNSTFVWNSYSIRNEVFVRIRFELKKSHLHTSNKKKYIKYMTTGMNEPKQQTW